MKKIFDVFCRKMNLKFTSRTPLAPSSQFPVPRSHLPHLSPPCSLFPVPCSPLSPRSLLSGFTILELLVASLLLAMLVTILTMLFNQSSIAWRTGVAGTLDLNTVRAGMGEFHDVEDDALPGLAERGVSTGSSDSRQIKFRTVSPWKNGALRARQRAFESIVQNQSPAIQIANARQGTAQNMGSGSTRGAAAFIVGVRSLGPDGQPNTDDDITTYPDVAE